MKAHIGLIVPLAIAVCMGSFALINMRKKELVMEEKKMKFQSVKLRVTDDVVNEYTKEKQNVNDGIKKEEEAQIQLQKELDKRKNNDGLKGELEACSGVKQTVIDQLNAVEADIKAVQEALAKEKSVWEAEIAALKEKLQKESPLCSYVRAGSSVPGVCPEKKKEVPKPEEPKPEEPKPDAPKAEEPQADAPKAEEPKPDAPKPEEPKPDAPK